MAEFPPVIWYIFLGAAGLYVLCVVAGSLPVMQISKAKLVPIGGFETANYLRLLHDKGFLDFQAAADHNYQPVGAYHIRNLIGYPKLIGWKRLNERTYLWINIVFDSQISLEIESIFGKFKLVTYMTDAGQIMPNVPNSFVQTFSVTSFEDICERHDSALRYLMDITKCRPDDSNLSIDDEFRNSVLRQSTYIRSVPFWFLRMPFWYLTRKKRHNKSIRELYSEHFIRNSAYELM